MIRWLKNLYERWKLDRECREIEQAARLMPELDELDRMADEGDQYL